MTNKIPTIFFGTHDFAVTILENLIKNPLISVDLVVTQPDRPVGRKKEMQAPLVKIFAQKNNLKFIQPETLKNFDELFPVPYSLLSNFQLAIVAQYGLIIPENIINAPKFGTLNVHTSLLPKYRGASPIQSAIINGEEKTGVTIMKMDKGLDTGPIISQEEIAIEQDDTYHTLDEKLAKTGAKLLNKSLSLYIEGKIKPIPQDDTQASTCKQLTRDDGKIDWTKSAKEVYNLYRGLYPWPGIWTTLNGKRLKLLDIKPTEKKYKTGTINIHEGRIYIGCADTSIEILELQLEGKKSMDAKTFLNGYHTLTGSNLN